MLSLSFLFQSKWQLTFALLFIGNIWAGKNNFQATNSAIAKNIKQTSPSNDLSLSKNRKVKRLAPIKIAKDLVRSAVVYRLSQQEIQLSGARSISDIIQVLPGVRVIKTGGIAQESFVSIRGSNPEQVLILVDGVKLNHSQGGGVDINSINFKNIKSIEIFPNGHPDYLQEGGLGGVINIETQPKQINKLNWLVNMSSDADFIFNLGIHLPKNEKKQSIYGNFLWSPGLFSFPDIHRGENKQRVNTEATEGGLQYSLFLKPKGIEKLGFQTAFQYKKRGVPGLVEFPTVNAIMEDLNYYLLIPFTLYSKKKKSKINLEWNINHKGQYRRYKNPDYFLRTLDDQHFNANSEIQLILSWQKNLSSFLFYRPLINFKYENNLLNSTAFKINQNSELAELIQRNNLVFNFSHLFTFKIFQLTYAMDLQWNNLKDWNDSHLIGLNLTFWQNRISIIYQFQSIYQLPSFSDLFWPETAFAIGNPNLLPERTYAHNLSHNFKIKKWRLAGNLFYKTSENIIEWVAGPSGRWKPINLSQTEAYGGEIKAHFYPLSNLKFSLAYNLLFFLDKTGGVNDGLQLPKKPHEIVQAQIHWQIKKIFSFYLDYQFVGFHYLTARNTKISEPYHLMNLSTRFILSPLFTLQLRLDNMLNEQYISPNESPVPGTQLQVSLAGKI